MSQNKILAFVVGLIATVLVFTAIVVVMARADKTSGPTAVVGVLSDTDLKGVKTKTGGLENFGNLPAIVTSGDLGRENPFDPY